MTLKDRRFLQQKQRCKEKQNDFHELMRQRAIWKAKRFAIHYGAGKQAVQRSILELTDQERRDLYLGSWDSATNTSA